MNLFIDSHAHIDSHGYSQERDDVILRSFQQEITHIIHIGSDKNSETIIEAISIAEKYPQVFCALGIHPHYANCMNQEILDLLYLQSLHQKVVAIGETGFDLYYQYSDEKVQAQVFEQHIELSLLRNKPLVVHTRNADAQTIEILRSHYGNKNQNHGVIHCFTSDLLAAKTYIDLGFFISFSGIITFKNAEELRKTAQFVPLDRMLIETDCPLLTPAPFRGKRNEPSYLIHTAKILADLKQVPLVELQNVTAKNALSLFHIQQDLPQKKSDAV